MDIKAHSNFIIASYFIFVVAGLGLVKYFYFPGISAKDIAVAIFNLAFFIGLGFLVRQGFKWTKYLLLVLTIFGLINIQHALGYVIQNPNVISLTVIMQRLILLLATILLFVVPATVRKDITDNNYLDKEV
ncbi:MAG TPA: hypothetical protein VE978_23530 [Chitinophagales bacterium]|nr:hypothetical protein [Chitinophagales bacterium]